MHVATFLLLLLLDLSVANGADEFTYNGFAGAGELVLHGAASVTPDGLLRLTGGSGETADVKGHAFYPAPLGFHNGSDGGGVRSFTSTFVFGIMSSFTDLAGHGIAFTVSSTRDFSGAAAAEYLGLFNRTTNGDRASRILAVELDTIYTPEFRDIDDNHVGVDVNGLESVAASTAGYYTPGGSFKNLSLTSRRAMQMWVEYDAGDARLDVTLHQLTKPKPTRPLLSVKLTNLSAAFSDQMYVGFSSSTGSHETSHYLLGWSFSLSGMAQQLDYTKLPSLPPVTATAASSKHMAVKIWLPVSLSLTVVATIVMFLLFRRQRRAIYVELVEDWEVEFGPHRFAYKDLHKATKGFHDDMVLGVGGFGKVYKGVMPGSGMDVAIKKVCHDSKQGMREFIAEIVSLGRLRHRNIVQLLGYCRRKGELLLVYDYMTNGSLDKYLYSKGKPVLNWAHRIHIIKGAASGLLYLHEEWEQVVIHRDIKASNVLLDSNMNGRLGDFGVARLYDHGAEPSTTTIVGTMGYLDPELTRTGQANTSSDVFAFGAFVLEVVCGRRPVQPRAAAGGERLVLVDWVLRAWRSGEITGAVDARLGGGYAADEAETLLKLALLCTHRLPAARPGMRRVVQWLDGGGGGGDVLDLLSPGHMDVAAPAFLCHDDADDDFVALSFPSASTATSPTTRFTN
uniref:non-specific serine/threonine protein kinase n=1 Tax=Oryza punctata TaxID=4537 RepID=A0A0E0KJJ7_ORYPU